MMNGYVDSYLFWELLTNQRHDERCLPHLGCWRRRQHKEEEMMMKCMSVNATEDVKCDRSLNYAQDV